MGLAFPAKLSVVVDVFPRWFVPKASLRNLPRQGPVADHRSLGIGVNRSSSGSIQSHRSHILRGEFFSSAEPTAERELSQRQNWQKTNRIEQK
jgi:hypothetical protein